MDMLASDGTTFTQAYCAYPLSGPSRASMMTGKMPVELNFLENNDSLPAYEVPNSLGFKLKNAGYDCLYAGKWHIPTVDIVDKKFGFKKLCGMNDPEMAYHIEKELVKKRNKPIFLVASYLNPHEICEFARSQTLHYGEVDIPADIKLPQLPENHNSENNLPEIVGIHKRVSPKLYPTFNYSEKDWKRYLYAYYRLVERVDKEIGKLIKILKKNDLYDNSIIIFTSDHGDGTTAHRWNQKRVLFEETVNIPLIIKPLKSSDNKGIKNKEALINTGTDIYPTICDFAGIEIPKELHGKSLKNVVLGKEKKLHKSISLETHLDGINARGWCVIMGDYKYVYYHIFKNKEQLFNLQTDKGETKNLINLPQYKQVREKMRIELLKHAKEINDKMLIKNLTMK